MNRGQRLAIAAAAVAVLAVLATVFGQQREPASGTAPSGPWLVGLKEALGSVQRVDIASGTARTSLRREGDNWGVSERDGYRVDPERLGDLLRELAAAKALERKTAKPEFFGRLGLDDTDKPGSTAVQVDIWRGDAAAAWRVLVGSAAEGRNGRYLRLAGSNETWLVDRSPQAFADPADWIDRKILGLDFARVAGVSRTLAGSAAFEAARADAGVVSLTVSSLPAGKRARYDSVFDAAARAVLTAEAEDVRKATPELFSGTTLAANRIRTFDGLTLEIDAVKASDGNWIRIKASGVASTAAAPAVKDAAAKAATPDPVAEAASIDARLSGWAYKVSDYIYGELSKPLAEYIEDEKTTEGAASDNPS